MTGDGDAVLAWILSRWQISSQDAVVGYTEEGHHAVPRLVVEPHLPWKKQALALRNSMHVCLVCFACEFFFFLQLLQISPSNYMQHYHGRFIRSWTKNEKLNRQVMNQNYLWVL